MTDLVRRVVRMGRVERVKVIGQTKGSEPAAAKVAVVRRVEMPPRHADAVVAAAKALSAVGVGPSQISELLGIPGSREAVKWWVRGKSRERVRMSQALYDTIMNAIAQAVAPTRR